MIDKSSLNSEVDDYFKAFVRMICANNATKVSILSTFDSVIAYNVCTKTCRSTDPKTDCVPID